MKNFITYIKNFPTRDSIYLFSQLSRMIYKSQLNGASDNAIACSIVIPIDGKRTGIFQKKREVLLTAWDIPEMAYLSIMNSNDYRSEDIKKEHIGKLVNLYRAYEKESSGKAFRQNVGSEGNPFAFIAGMTYEQFRLQNLSWIIQSFNRNYHILYHSSFINRDGLKNLEEIVKDKFGMSVEDFLLTEIMLWGLCTKTPIPLEIPEEVYRKKKETILTKDNIKKVVDYYSITYKGVWSSKLGKQHFNSKPFILTDRSKEYILISTYLLSTQIADVLYWLLRDYHKNDAQVFPNKFGDMFEDYFSELAREYLEKVTWYKIPETKRKRADFYVEFEDVVFLFELKSGIMSINAKQQNPDVEEVTKFVVRNIKEAYEQLCNSEKEYLGHKPVIKIFLLYEMMMNEHVMKLVIPEIFDTDTNCHIMTIQEVERLFAIYKYDYESFQKVISELLSNMNEDCQYQTVGAIIDEFNSEEMHFVGDRDYLEKLLKRLELKLQ